MEEFLKRKRIKNHKSKLTERPYSLNTSQWNMAIYVQDGVENFYKKISRLSWIAADEFKFLSYKQFYWFVWMFAKLRRRSLCKLKGKINICFPNLAKDTFGWCGVFKQSVNTAILHIFILLGSLDTQ